MKTHYHTMKIVLTTVCAAAALDLTCTPGAAADGTAPANKAATATPEEPLSAEAAYARLSPHAQLLVQSAEAIGEVRKAAGKVDGKDKAASQLFNEKVDKLLFVLEQAKRAKEESDQPPPTRAAEEFCKQYLAYSAESFHATEREIEEAVDRLTEARFYGDKAIESACKKLAPFMTADPPKDATPEQVKKAQATAAEKAKEIREKFPQSVKGGDGFTVDTAWVIPEKEDRRAVQQEYAIIAHLGLPRPNVQTLLHANNRRYDALGIVMTLDGEPNPVVVWQFFDITEAGPSQPAEVKRPGTEK